MTKEESKIIQGVAILLMIFYHLFEPHMNPEYTDMILGNLARTQNPVPFYVTISGFGMYFVTHQGFPDQHRFSRIGKLYWRYWVITSIFVLISRLLGDKRCGLSCVEVLGNLSGVSTTYNAVMWFLLPYVLLSLSAPLLFYVMDRKRGSIISLIIGFLIYCGASLVSGKKLRVIKKASFDDTLITWLNQLLCPLKETM